MIEAASNYYSLRDAWQIVASRLKRKPEPVRAGRSPGSRSPPGSPRTEIERTVFAALFLAGEPVNNRRLAELMRVSTRGSHDGSRSSKA